MDSSPPQPSGPREGSASHVSVPADLLQRITADVTERAHVAEAAIRVVKALRVTWPDGSMGCPQPGMAYTQALVPGFWVVVEVDGLVYDYRASARGGFRLCPSGSSGADGRVGLDPLL